MCIYIYILLYIIYTHTCAYINTYMSIHIYTYIHMRMYIHRHVYVYTCIYIYVCVCCMYGYGYRLSGMCRCECSPLFVVLYLPSCLFVCDFFAEAVFQGLGTSSMLYELDLTRLNYVHIYICICVRTCVYTDMNILIHIDLYTHIQITKWKGRNLE